MLERIRRRRYIFSWDDGGRRKLLFDTQILGNIAKILLRRAGTGAGALRDWIGDQQNADKTSSVECNAHSAQEGPEKNNWINTDSVVTILVLVVVI